VGIGKIAFVSVLLIAAATLKTATAQPSLALADSLTAAGADPLALADAYSEAWEHQKAITTLVNWAIKCGKTPADAAILWRLARSRIDQGENLTGEAALELYERAQEEAWVATVEDSLNADAQQTLAIAYGRIALFKGVFKSAGLAKKVYYHAHRALALSDSMPRSCYILGRLHQELTAKPGFALSLMGLGWASEDSIGWYYERALRLNPNLIQTRVAFAEYTLHNKKDIILTKKLLEDAIHLPARDEQDVPAQTQAREMLRKIG